MGHTEIPNIKGLRTSFSRVLGQKEALEDRLSEVSGEIADLVEEEAVLDRVEVLFQSLINTEIEDAVQAVENLQKEALSAVFEDMDLSVRADVSVERGKVSVSLVTVEDTSDFVVEGDTTEAFGQSVATVQSLLLRILVLMRRGLRPFVVLDEALPAFDPNYIGNMGQFLSSLCEKLGLDILMVTHNPVLFESADHSYRVQKVGSSAKFVSTNEDS